MLQSAAGAGLFNEEGLYLKFEGFLGYSGVFAAGCEGSTMAELEDAKFDLARHQEALDIVSAFAGQLHGHMQTRTDSEGGFKHAPEVEQACGDVAGVHCHRTC